MHSSKQLLLIKHFKLSQGQKCPLNISTLFYINKGLQNLIIEKVESPENKSCIEQEYGRRDCIYTLVIL